MLKIFFGGMLATFSFIVQAQDYAIDSDEGVPGEEMFQVCVFCHGAQAQGGPALDAPALAGQHAWYIEKQLKAFKSRTRGVHPDDVPGLQMSIISGSVRNEATIKNISAYIASLPSGAPLELARTGEVASIERPFIWDSEYAKLTPPKDANAETGKALYATCTTCHGADGQGNQDFGAPKLTDLTPKYMHRQIQYFQDGVRGADPQDAQGMTMAAFAKLLKDDQAIADVVAYIKTIEVK